MFKFSFPNPSDEDNRNDEELLSSEEPKEEHWITSDEVKVLPSHLEAMLSNQESIEHTEICNLRLPHFSTKYIVNSAVKNPNDNSIIKVAEELHSDLVTAKYEGGLKIWECTIDLLEWLLSSSSHVNLDGKCILDLGCGAGLLGIAALKFGANVTFQDYNKEVLDMCTIPNVLLNLSDEESSNLMKKDKQNDVRCEFYSGDWSSFPSKLNEGRTDSLKFDYILTSETIYNLENYHKLYSVFKNCLKSSGCVYLAAKTYYFGVGGGLREFEAALLKDGTLKSEVCWRCPSGLSREILKITFAA